MLFHKFCRFDNVSILRRCFYSRSYSSTGASNIKHRPISKLLIANRGEIACRIMSTARRMGIRTVAVYSDVDRDAMHVANADEAHCIGPASAALSYLSIDNILNVAHRTGAEAIHPGYGFLSENANFAERCQSANVVFVGPPASAIRDMGIKNKAKQMMSDAGVPVIVGYHGTDQSNERLFNEAKRIGFPIMAKAVYGGGGKGMRIAHSEKDFFDQLESARREAAKAFGNSDMLIEKYVERPRHVEVQVFGDMHGNYVYLFERDCSIQRRHQKVIEEAPAPRLNNQTREYLGKAAVSAARAVKYVGAGTVEFIMDSNENFFFMEMNTRLQVEHPVSEMITGTDLVEWQLRVAQGEQLPIVDQSSIKCNGHAMEARIYAEDPANSFMPGAGPLVHLRFPKSSTVLRVETGVRQGDEVSVYYDPMIAKIVVWGIDRQSAVRRLDAALRDTHIAGLKTNVPFVRAVLAHNEFKRGNVYTDFIADHERELFADEWTPTLGVDACIAQLLIDRYSKQIATNDPFDSIDDFRVNLRHRQTIVIGNRSFQLIVNGNDSYSIETTDGVDTVQLIDVQYDARQSVIEFVIADENGNRRQVKAVDTHDGSITLFAENGQIVDWQRPSPKWMHINDDVSGDAGSLAPMPGVIEKIMIGVGDAIKAGQPMVVMVAMKMEYVIRAPRDGIVETILCAQGQNVNKNATLVKLTH